MSGTTAADPAKQRPSGRIAGLDGLRGIAALVVVVLHSLLLSSAFVGPFADPRPTTTPADVMWWATYTPVHLVWEGTAAVFVFFVLSGFVLCLPAARARLDWLAYYPSRLIRLYLPVWASVGLAIAWFYIVPDLAEGSPFVQIHQEPILLAVLRDLILVVPAQPGWTNTVLWSLKWEIIFSLLLPLFILFAAKLRRFVLVKLALLLVVLVVGAYQGPIERPYAMSALFQLPIFALGCLAAFEWDRIVALRDRMSNRRMVFAWLSLISGVLVMSYWGVFAVPLDDAVLNAIAPVTRVLQVLGAGLAVVVVAASPGIGAALSAGPLHWLGTRSFSLYLVHEPMIIALGGLIGEPPVPPAILAITIPVALGLAELFFRLVERPSHRLARAMSSRIRARRPTTVQEASA